MDRNHPVHPRKDPLSVDIPPSLERRVPRTTSHGHSDLGMQRDRLKRNQPMTILPLVIILGVLFAGLLGFTLLRSAGGWFSGGASTPVALTRAPRLDTLPEFTNQPTLDVKGTTSQNTQVQIVINDQQGSIVQADQNGQFLFRRVPLEEGENRIKVSLSGTTATAVAASEKDSKEYIVTLDTTLPTLTIAKVSSTATQSPLTITGQTDANELFVAGAFTHIASDGSFTAEVPLSEGSNEIEVRAVDKAKNEATQTITITFKGSTTTTPTPDGSKSPTPAKSKTPAGSVTAAPKSPTVVKTVAPVVTPTPKPTVLVGTKTPVSLTPRV